MTILLITLIFLIIAYYIGLYQVLTNDLLLTKKEFLIQIIPFYVWIKNIINFYKKLDQ